MRTLIPVLLALALAGCAELRWAKPGADALAIQEDLDGCRAQARVTAARTADLGMRPALDPRFGPETGATRRAEQPIQQEDQIQRCMRDKGYHLVPAEK